VYGVSPRRGGGQDPAPPREQPGCGGQRALATGSVGCPDWLAGQHKACSFRAICRFERCLIRSTRRAWSPTRPFALPEGSHQIAAIARGDCLAVGDQRCDRPCRPHWRITSAAEDRTAMCVRDRTMPAVPSTCHEQRSRVDPADSRGHCKRAVLPGTCRSPGRAESLDTAWPARLVQSAQPSAAGGPMMPRDLRTCQQGTGEPDDQAPARLDSSCDVARDPRHGSDDYWPLGCCSSGG
jgi:hypothetical protein